MRAVGARERNVMDDDPLIDAVKVILTYNDVVSRYVTDLTNNDTDDIEDGKRKFKLNIMNSVSNRLSFINWLTQN